MPSNENELLLAEGSVLGCSGSSGSTEIAPGESGSAVAMLRAAAACSCLSFHHRSLCRPRCVLGMALVPPGRGLPLLTFPERLPFLLLESIPRSLLGDFSCMVVLCTFSQGKDIGVISTTASPGVKASEQTASPIPDTERNQPSQPEFGVLWRVRVKVGSASCRFGHLIITRTNPSPKIWAATTHPAADIPARASSCQNSVARGHQCCWPEEILTRGVCAWEPKSFPSGIFS